MSNSLMDLANASYLAAEPDQPKHIIAMDCIGGVVSLVRKGEISRRDGLERIARLCHTGLILRLAPRLRVVESGRVHKVPQSTPPTD